MADAAQPQGNHAHSPPPDPSTPAEEYVFPEYRLKRVMDDAEKTPLLLVACGSFSPITFLHLRMFEMAADYVKLSTDFEIVGGYLSPVSDAYRKAGLASAEHRWVLFSVHSNIFICWPITDCALFGRVSMCQRAVDASDWLMVDTWEPMHKEYQPTAIVLDHFDYEINTVRNGIDTGNGSRKPVQVVLLAGADLVHTMSTPGVWSEKDLDHILGQYGVCLATAVRPR